MGLHPVILGSHIRIASQVVAEGKMPNDLRRAVLVAVNLDKSAAGDRLRFGVVSPPRQTECAPAFIAGCFHLTLATIQRCKLADHRHEVEYGLGVDAGNSRRADMMNGQQRRANNLCEQFRFDARQFRPARIMRQQSDFDRRRHLRVQSPSSFPRRGTEIPTGTVPGRGPA